ncbi:uncharacterized protein K441DRAFT_667493 [Cenococcum geophilum 1.58]|uniref:uncharacterized protein n=1 Tax=Cenococcum geophilum 1.58 TaxID=794803 RepID=UPI00358E50FC|nr:hypothetical protein K441DRAFT_667493 [Cenococcum geophilum 1.58]
MAAHQNRSSAHPKKPLPAHARPSKPAPLLKRVNSHGTNKGGHKAAQHTEEDLEDEESMATSFLQYCTSCEKQIIVPNNSALYCSEICRKKDNEKILSYSSEHSPPPTPFSNFSFEDLPIRDIVAPRSPTAAPSQRSSSAFSEASLEDSTLSGDERLRRDSEASRYLRQFQSTTAMAETSGRQTRPRYNRSPMSMVTMSAAPSLSHTPTSSASMSMPYTPSNRPLPPRSNPHSSSYGSRSIDLVMPFTATAAASSLSQYSLKSAASSRTSIDAVEGEILYEKQSTIPTASPANGSLKQLFASTPR